MYGARRAGPFPGGTWWCLRGRSSWCSAGRHLTADVVASVWVGRVPAGCGEPRIGVPVGSGSTIAGGRPGVARGGHPVVARRGVRPDSSGRLRAVRGRGGEVGRKGAGRCAFGYTGERRCLAATGGGCGAAGNSVGLAVRVVTLGGRPWRGWAGARRAAAGRGQDAAVSGSADGRGRGKGGAGRPAAHEASRGEASAGPVGLSGGGGRGGRLPRGDRATCCVAGHGPGV